MKDKTSFNVELVGETYPTLHEMTLPWDFQNPMVDIHDLLVKMTHTMVINRGIGLAAPQIGVPARMFIMRDGEKNIVCVNPEILVLDKKTVKLMEGCLSFPNLLIPVERAESVTVRYMDQNGNVVENHFDGILARCFQHELDHLDGICFIKRVSKIVRDIAERKRRKFIKGK